MTTGGHASPPAPGSCAASRADLEKGRGAVASPRRRRLRVPSVASHPVPAPRIALSCIPGSTPSLKAGGVSRSTTSHVPFTYISTRPSPPNLICARNIDVILFAPVGRSSPAHLERHPHVGQRMKLAECVRPLPTAAGSTPRGASPRSRCGTGSGVTCVRLLHTAWPK